MKTKAVPADARIQAVREDVIAAIRKHGDKVTGVEILAILSHMVGQTIAFQDQRVVTPSMAMQIVSENIEAGNAEVMAQINAKPAGNA